MEGGVFCNFGFGLREKVGNLDFGGYSVTSDLDLGKKKFWKFGLREKVGNLDFGGGVFCKGDGKRKKPTLQKNLPDQFGIIIHLNILTLAPYSEPNKICLTFLKSGVKVSTKLC